MSSRKAKRSGRARARASNPPADQRRQRDLWVRLEAAEELMRQQRWLEAAELLEDLEERWPMSPELLTLLGNAYLRLERGSAVESVCERLLQVRPDDPELASSLVGSYLSNDRPALARLALHNLVNRWPDHPAALEARAALPELETELTQMLAELGISGDDRYELAEMHERVQSLTESGRFGEARRLAERLLRQCPNFEAALNNLSLIEANEGRLDEAVAAARRALEGAPANVHALANLVIFHCLKGSLAEASEWAVRLKAIAPTNLADLLKQAEALSYLGDDEGVLASFAAWSQREPDRSRSAEGRFHHLAAVAVLRQGDEARARTLWQQALELSPGLQTAQDNLDDLDQPPGRRHAPWPFGLRNWMSASAFQALDANISRLADQLSEESLGRAVRRFLRAHPEIPRLLPTLLDRGDPPGRVLAVQVAKMAAAPEMLAALRDFALGQRGPEALRLEAASTAAHAGLIAAGPVRMWQGGEWRELILVGCELHGEPAGRHGREATRWMLLALEALRDRRGVEAEVALEKALALEPGAPDLLNNLAAAYQLQGRQEESEQLIRRIHEQHPDYLFGRTRMAQLAVAGGDLDAARALLNPLLQRKRLHYSEFAALCEAQIELSVASGDLDSARHWVGMWEATGVEHPNLPRWIRELGSGVPPGRWDR